MCIVFDMLDLYNKNLNRSLIMIFRSVLVLMCAVFFSGCAATVKRDSSDAALPAITGRPTSKLVLNVSGASETTGAKDWSGFKQEWQEKFQEQAEAAQIKFEMQDGSPRSTGEDGVLLSVFVNDYRFIRPGTRYAVGVMSGNAFIESKLTFLDLRTGASLGTQSANTSSSAWEGVFSAMTDKQVEAIAVDVFKIIKSDEK